MGTDKPPISFCSRVMHYTYELLHTTAHCATCGGSDLQVLAKALETRDLDSVGLTQRDKAQRLRDAIQRELQTMVSKPAACRC